MFRNKFLLIILNLLAIGHFSEQFVCIKNNMDGTDNDECIERSSILPNHKMITDQSNGHYNNNNNRLIRLANSKEMEKLWPIIELYRRKLFESNKRNVNRNFQTQGW
ncbi:uncharacterized protein LOC142645079 isoform X2 [Dermatophagoides pteronyssinus]|uniref:uncharacterized protein LOC142645079 isoform X2 n=1 Tax=Dermatophagoides pteronyssinus TaxID=6956 RepID=UPI003F679081